MTKIIRVRRLQQNIKLYFSSRLGKKVGFTGLNKTNNHSSVVIWVWTKHRDLDQTNTNTSVGDLDQTNTNTSAVVEGTL